ncbi:hypothetical protein MY5147_007634, partial [Beauveria neobassiana]
MTRKILAPPVQHPPQPPMQAPPTTTTTTTPPIRQDGIPAKLVKPWTLPPQKTYVLLNANVVDAANGSIVPRQT